MKEGLTLNEMAAEITRQNSMKEDYLVDTPVVLSLIHISEPTRRTPISYAVFCLKKKKKQ